MTPTTIQVMPKRSKKRTFTDHAHAVADVLAVSNHASKFKVDDADVIAYTAHRLSVFTVALWLVLGIYLFAGLSHMSECPLSMYVHILVIGYE